MLGMVKRTVKRDIHKHQVYRRVVHKRMVVKLVNRNNRLAWGLQKRKWTVNDNWKRIIFSDEPRVVIGQIISSLFRDQVMKYITLNANPKFLLG